ncbi:MAG TPA: biotin attachment protein, partial [Sulfurovum sp.]|nr:biotin attachment protein [Sulfurovum sp.]
APGYGRMVLGRFGKTPVAPDPEIVALAAAKLDLEPTTENPLDIADRNVEKSISHWTKVLEEEGLETSEENIFIAASCDKKGIAFLKGDGPLMVRKGEKECNGAEMAGNYTVVVDGKQYSVQVAEGDADIQVAPSAAPVAAATTAAPAAQGGKGAVEINAQTPGSVWKVNKKVGDSVAEGEVVMILEAMKMEIDIPAPSAGTITSIDVNTNDSVQDGQLLATIS